VFGRSSFITWVLAERTRTKGASAKACRPTEAPAMPLLRGELQLQPPRAAECAVRRGGRGAQRGSGSLLHSNEQCLQQEQTAEECAGSRRRPFPPIASHAAPRRGSRNSHGRCFEATASAAEAGEARAGRPRAASTVTGSRAAGSRAAGSRAAGSRAAGSTVPGSAAPGPRRAGSRTAIDEQFSESEDEGVQDYKRGGATRSARERSSRMGGTWSNGSWGGGTSPLSGLPGTAIKR